MFITTSLVIGLGGCAEFTGANRSLVPVSASSNARLESMGSSRAEAMLIRLFKESSEIEVWKRTTDGTYALFKVYPICAWSGVLGPKLVEGDRQAPEGFYSVTPSMLNPLSALYLSFNTGFPNKYDRAYGRTGTNLMIHGGCSSAGCYAVTDEQIKEIYALARDSFEAGNQNFQLQMYPFRMTPENLGRFTNDPNRDFWANLKVGYDLFEKTRRPPSWDVCDLKYIFEDQGSADNVLGARVACPSKSTPV